MPDYPSGEAMSPLAAQIVLSRLLFTFLTANYGKFLIPFHLTLSGLSVYSPMEKWQDLGPFPAGTEMGLEWDRNYRNISIDGSRKSALMPLSP